MILDVVGRLAVRDLPDEVALVHVERRDAAVRRLDERQPLHREPAGPAAFGRRGAWFTGTGAATPGVPASPPAGAPPARPRPAGAGAFGSRAMPEMYAKSDRPPSFFSSPNAVGVVVEYT